MSERGSLHLQSRVCPGGSFHSSLKNMIPRHSTVQHTLENLTRRCHYSPGQERVGSVRTGMRLGKNKRKIKNTGTTSKEHCRNEDPSQDILKCLRITREWHLTYQFCINTEHLHIVKVSNAYSKKSSGNFTSTINQSRSCSS